MGATRTAGIKRVLREPKRSIHRHVEQPKPDGNRRQRRAYAAQQKRTSDTLKLILSGKSQPAYPGGLKKKDKRPL